MFTCTQCVKLWGISLGTKAMVHPLALRRTEKYSKTAIFLALFSLRGVFFKTRKTTFFFILYTFLAFALYVKLNKSFVLCIIDHFLKNTKKLKVSVECWMLALILGWSIYGIFEHGPYKLAHQMQKNRFITFSCVSEA